MPGKCVVFEASGNIERKREGKEGENTCKEKEGKHNVRRINGGRKEGRKKTCLFIPNELSTSDSTP